MFKNYLKIAFRNIIRHKTYSLINISGLALGIACCMLIALFVKHELNYDRYHEKAKNIYRVERFINFEDFYGGIPITSHPYGPALKKDFPEIKEMVRIWPRSTDILDQNNQYNRAKFIYADASVFDVFTWPLIKGDEKSALSDPFSIVITESLAKRYYLDTDPLGQTLTMQLGTDQDYKVTGILKDIPDNSHFKFDAIVSYKTLKSVLGEEVLQTWFSHYIYTYVLLQENVDPHELEAKFPVWQEKYMGDIGRKLFGVKGKVHDYFKIVFKPLIDIHLYSNLEWEIEPNGNINTVYIFSGIAFLTLLIACINFMNLSTARSVDRAKEVGLRKVVGANRSRLIFQFFSESIILAFIALIISLLLIEFLIPIFSSLSEKRLTVDYFTDPSLILSLITITIFVGIFAGSYPAFFLSSFRPVAILKGKFKSNTSGLLLRKILVIIQFSISIVLIISTITIMNQLDFLQNKKLGFDEKHIVVISINDGDVRLSDIKALQNEIKKNPSVVSVTASNRVPGAPRFGDTIFRLDRDEHILEEKVNLRWFGVNHDFLSTLGMELVAGRDFSRQFITDSSGAYIINEAAMKKIGWESAESAIDKRFARMVANNPPKFREGKIVGVVKDFHFKSLHQSVEPLVLELNLKTFQYIIVRIHPEKIARTLGFLEEKIKQISPKYPFEYFFQDEYIDNLYKNERRLMDIFGYFTILTIFIACLGLFGLASCSSEQRTKEMGIRKVLGASALTLLIQLTKEYTKWVLLANIIAWPIAFYMMNRWLQSFAYRINITIEIFILAAVVGLVIALFTISYQALKVALANPVDALRYE